MRSVQSVLEEEAAALERDPLGFEPSGWARFLDTAIGLVALVAAAWWAWDIAGRPVLGDQDLIWEVGLFGLGVVASLLAHAVIHELGHLLAALIMGLRVRALAIGPVRIGGPAPSPGTGGHVLFDEPAADSRAVGLRMVIAALGGPIANLATAAVTGWVALDAGQALPVRLVAAAATCIGVADAAVNLLPVSAGPLRSDGDQIVGWLLRPAAERRTRLLHHDLQALLAAARAGACGDSSLATFRAAVADPRPDIARLGIVFFMNCLLRAPRASGDVSTASVWLAAILQDLPLIEEYVQRRDQSAKLRALVAAAAADVVTVACFAGAADSRTPAPELVEYQARLAGYAWNADPDWVYARALVAMSWILRAQPTRASDLLAATGFEARDSDERAAVLAIRGLAEATAGDGARAQRLADASREAGRSPFYQWLLDDALTREGVE